MSITASVPLSKIAISGVLFVITLLSGVLLSHLGRPFNGLVFNIHKLIAVATVIFIGLHLYRLQQLVGARAFIDLAVMATAALLFLALIVTGGLLTLDIARPVALKIHQIAPPLALFGASAVLYLLVGGRS